MKGDFTIQVSKPPAEVFAYIADLENAPQWVPDLVSVTKVSAGVVGVGTRYDEVVRMGGKESTAELEVTEYEPDRTFAHKGQGGPAHFTGRFIVEPDKGGTRLRHEYTVEMTGFAKLMAPFANRWVKKNTEAGLENLKRKLEG